MHCLSTCVGMRRARIQRPHLLVCRRTACGPGALPLMRWSGGASCSGTLYVLSRSASWGHTYLSLCASVASFRLRAAALRSYLRISAATAVAHPELRPGSAPAPAGAWAAGALLRALPTTLRAHIRGQGRAGPHTPLLARGRTPRSLGCLRWRLAICALGVSPEVRICQSLGRPALGQLIPGRNRASFCAPGQR